MSIEVAGVHQVFDGGKGERVTALQEVDLCVEERQFVTILGPSGCGKTTLLNLVAGFETPTSGEVRCDGRVVTRPGSDRAVVFQQAALYPWLSVRENIALGLRLRDGRRADMGKVERLIDAMGLVGFEDHAPHQLSGGMAQRVAIARALVIEPSVLLMDEPFGALDAQTRAAMQIFVTNLWEKLPVTVLFVTHDIDEAIILADRVIVMAPRPGRVVADLPCLLERPRTRRETVGPEYVELRRKILEHMDPSALEEVGT
ncbi:MAG: ABC transporter ATP-binding protein [Marmoricola sp.]